MNFNQRWVLAALGVVWFTALQEPLSAQPRASQLSASEIRILAIEGPPAAVEVMRAGSAVWDPAYTNQVLRAGDRIRTRDHGRVTLKWSDQSTVRIPPLSDLEIQAPPGPKTQSGFNLIRGLLYFFHRDKPTDARFNTRTASAAVRGTEFVLQFVEAEARTILTVLDGEVLLSNADGQTNLVSGEQGISETGKPPSKTAVIETINVIQWFLYYPGVLDVEGLELSADEKQILADSLAAYRSGDLLQALAKYPAGREPASAAEKVYYSALLLAVGQVDRTGALLSSLSVAQDSRTARLAGALHTVIAAAKLQPRATALDTARVDALASEWLAESYYHQSRADLPKALDAAKRAVKKSPQFGLGWARVAELQFSFGHTTEALAALEKSLKLSPRNAQAFALKGFLLSAQNKISDAITWFDRAIALDGGLGNAWLGRGLCKIRQGRTTEGKDDIQVAVTMEPQRALFRSYLSKAYTQAGDNTRARREIELAKQKDLRDPTSWLYSALLNQQDNRINEAVRDLEHSQELNNNRAVYRSRLLLDQDRAVRGANLAAVYRDAGMFDVSVREAARAVNADYANYSAHLFLANSYAELLNTPQINQRFETPRVSEYLVATLLAPVGAGVLSQTVSQQEYSKLFERDGIGFTSSSAYLSRGAWSEYAAQYGTFGNFSYSLDGFYQTDPGQRVNNDLELYLTSLQLKQQITPRDNIYLQTVYSHQKFGDLGQRYDPVTQVNPGVRIKETQEPLLLAGYHHEWGPGRHTLFLAGRLTDSVNVNDPFFGTIITTRAVTDGPVVGAADFGLAQRYDSGLEVYTAELQHIVQEDRYTIVAGGRYQWGDFTTRNTNELSVWLNPAGVPVFPPFFDTPEQNVRSEFERASVYGYAHWQATCTLGLIGGATFDWLRYPLNFRFAPVSSGENSVQRLSPKAGFIWTPADSTTLRMAYSRSLGGVSFDQSFQLEPSQMAGFNQAWRSIIPESVAGASAAARFESWDVSLEQKLPSRTYVGWAGEVLKSKMSRVVGTFDLNPPPVGPIVPFIHNSSTGERLDYEERSLFITLNQLLGDNWAVGARYRFSQAELDRLYPDLPSFSPGAYIGEFRPHRFQKASLHQANLFANYNCRCGFFAEVDSIWSAQRNRGDDAGLADDDFWQFNAFAGYRFPRRQAELRVGVLNLTDRDYRLNPLNLTPELPRERTVAVSFRFSF